MTQNHNNPSVEQLLAVDLSSFPATQASSWVAVDDAIASLGSSHKKRRSRAKSKNFLAQKLYEYMDELHQQSGAESKDQYINGIQSVIRYIENYSPRKSEDMEYIRGMYAACKVALENFQEDVVEVPEPEIKTASFENYDDF